MLVSEDTITEVRVVRGAPCGATHEASKKIIGTPVAESEVRFGLEVQLFCFADPSAWDPIYGKSPVHFAGNIHRNAFLKALRKI